MGWLWIWPCSPSWVQLCLTLAPILCAGSLNTHIFWNWDWVLEFKRIKKKYVRLLKTSAHNWHTITPFHILLVKKSFFIFKRNLNYDLNNNEAQNQWVWKYNSTLYWEDLKSAKSNSVDICSYYKEEAEWSNHQSHTLLWCIFCPYYINKAIILIVLFWLSNIIYDIYKIVHI